MIFLKFPDKETFLSEVKKTNFGYFVAALDDEGNNTYDDDGNQIFTDEFVFVRSSSDYEIDIIGDIFSSYGEYEFNESGESIEISPPVKVDGYHVNMIGEIPESFIPYVIDRPSSPSRVFFGY